MSPGKRPKAAPPSFRTEVTRRAATLGVKPEDLERALIIGQIAGLLAKDPALKGKIAHKGAAMLHLVNRSQRLSRDLDSADIRGQQIDERAVRRALETVGPRKVVARIDRIAAGGAESLTLLVHCRALRGGSTVGITVSINWSEPFTLKPVMESYQLPDGTSISVPVMDPRERAAEKVRAFLTRGEASDAYDLWWYATKVLTASEVLGLGTLIQTKLGRSRLGSGDVLVRFDEMRDNANGEWTAGTGLVIAGPKPTWTEVDKALGRFKGVTPHRAHP